MNEMEKVEGVVDRWRQVCVSVRGHRCVADRCVLWFTDKGTVQKVIVLPRDDLQTEELVLEEVEVFKVSFPPFVFPLYFISLCTVLFVRHYCFSP